MLYSSVGTRAFEVIPSSRILFFFYTFRLRKDAIYVYHDVLTDAVARGRDLP